jgi:hypothetical protein
MSRVGAASPSLYEAPPKRGGMDASGGDVTPLALAGHRSADRRGWAVHGLFPGRPSLKRHCHTSAIYRRR